MEGSAELPRGTVTFLFTDIERSTELVRELGVDFGPLRSAHRRILRDAFSRHAGHEIDTAGDGFFVVFAAARDAVEAAVDAQHALLTLAQGERAPLRVRMGLHTAEPYLHEDGYVGVGVHRAARICAVGHGGQILVSNATAGVVEDLGLEDVQLLDLGEYELKDMPRPQRLFQLTVEGLPSEFPALNSLDPGRSRPSIMTLLQTDVSGWQRVLRTLGDEGATEVARSYHGLVLRTVKQSGGRELEVVGDTVLAAFERPRDAVRAAITLRDALQTEAWFPGEQRPGVRMAIHSGHVVDPTSKHLGSVGFRCVVLCNTAEPGQILVSHATEALLEGSPPDVRLRDLGERTLGSTDRPVHVFELE